MRRRDLGPRALKKLHAATELNEADSKAEALGRLAAARRADNAEGLSLWHLSACASNAANYCWRSNQSTVISGLRPVLVRTVAAKGPGFDAYVVEEVAREN